MTDIQTTTKPEVSEPKKKVASNKRVLTHKATAQYSWMNNVNGNPWSPSDVDRYEFTDDKDDFKKVIDSCRFFYKKDPIASTVINKMIDIGINDIIFNKNGLTDNEFRVFLALKDKLKEFSETMAMEFLISGLVVPEVRYAPVNKEEIKDLGIKKYETLQLPVSMWLRDPSTIKINKSAVAEKPSYFLEVPAEVVYFIMHEGMYPDGTQDKKAYAEVLAYYPDFVAKVREGQRMFLIEDPDLIFARRTLTNEAYPTPFLYSAIEPMKHKRNLRRMDYSLASRVISAIMLVKLGSDTFPITEEDEDAFDQIKSQMYWRNTNERDVERVFQLFGNHTLSIEWVFPPTEVLLNETKYKDINQDIIFALGFPRILITGETEKSNTSDAQFASSSPVKTMDNFRFKIVTVLKQIVAEVSKLNRFKSIPNVNFRPLQIAEFKTFTDALLSLYNTGNLSRTSLSEFFGYSWEDEVEKRASEQDTLKQFDVPEFAPQPHSQNPELGTTTPAKTETKPKAAKTEPKSTK